jgi:hypothetical protein
VIAFKKQYFTYDSAIEIEAGRFFKKESFPTCADAQVGKEVNPLAFILNAKYRILCFFCDRLYFKVPVMLTSPLHTIWVARFFILIYLLISVSTANASFWCHEPGSSPHFESNPAGECFPARPAENDECCEKTTEPGVLLSVQMEGCFDAPVYSSVITPANRTSPLNKITATDLSQINPRRTLIKSSGTAHVFDLSIASKLPLSQTLKALHSVILLH